jgi:aryl-alcohol dehydrogenase-like predicted oxidoreductase
MATNIPPAARAGTITIGGSDTVNRVGFGAMRLTGPGIWGEPEDPAECRRVLRRAVELGVNFIDTADSYGPEVSERLIGDALYPYPAGLLIATKGGLRRPGPGQWEPDGRPEHLRDTCEGSLRRLRLDTIDLYQLHRPDPRVPYEESLGALVRLREEGKIRMIGVSNVSLEHLETAMQAAEVVSVQNRCNLADRESEPVLRRCEDLGIAFLPWGPLATGELARPGSALREVAGRHGASPGQIALAWLLARSPVVLPIPGTSRVAHLEENVAAAAIKLETSEVQALAA